MDDFGSVILTKVIGEDLQIDDLCNSIETSHRSKRVLRIIENRGILKKIGETPMNVPDVVLYLMIFHSSPEIPENIFNLHLLSIH